MVSIFILVLKIINVANKTTLKRFRKTTHKRAGKSRLVIKPPIQFTPPIPNRPGAGGLYLVNTLRTFRRVNGICP